MVMTESVPRSSRIGRWTLYGLGTLVALAGLALGAGGVKLLLLGGSLYFALMGLALIASGVLIFMGKRAGAWLYAGALLATMIWAWWEVGSDFWPLVSRIFAFAAGAVFVALAYPLLQHQAGKRGTLIASLCIAALLLAGLGVTISGFYARHGVVRADRDTAVMRAVTRVAPGSEQRDWAHWGNTTAGTRFVALDQIDRRNVGKLRLAWRFRTGSTALSDRDGNGAEDQNTPLQIGDTVYVCTAYGQVFALDADSGTQRWRFDPKATAPDSQRCRGLGYYDAGGRPPVTPLPATSALCRRRLFLPTSDARLIAIDADTGRRCRGFGTEGEIDLLVDMGVVEPGYYSLTSAPLVAGNLVVVGGRVDDNRSVGEPGGVVRAFDVITGALVWAWDPGDPAITKLPPPGKSYTRGTPNVWSAMAYDAKLGLIYMPTGNATPDFWAGQRTELDDKFSSSVVAVDARTGRVRWTFQTVHHDLWDYDVPAQPLLYDIPDGKGGIVPALVEVTKRGEIFLLDRATGDPLAPVEERKVPAGTVQGERYAPTQPFSVGMPAIGNAELRESDMWGMTPFDQLSCRIQFRKLRYQGQFTPPGLDDALQYPGTFGGMNWGSVSVDPTSGLMFVNDMRLGHKSRLVPRAQIRRNAKGIELGVASQAGTPFGVWRGRFLSPFGIPCQKPPYGTMSAIDLRTRKLVWQVPVGTAENSAPLGMKIPIGMPTLGASLATQSGLLFFAGSQDFYLRAFDSTTGRELWRARLPVGSQSGPITYRSPKTGKQYVLVTAGGARESPLRGDFVQAYALP